MKPTHAVHCLHASHANDATNLHLFHVPKYQVAMKIAQK